jgi:DNA-binding SARP family transcriptional activator
VTSFHLNLLGRAVIEGPEGPLEGPVTQRNRLAFLTRLALSPHGVSSREKLMACLWPERDAEHARHALSNSLYVIRKALGDDAVLTRGDDLQLNLARVSVDAVDLESAVQAGDYEDAAELYLGPLLDGFHLDRASEFDHWLDGQRDRLARAHDHTLEQLALAAMAEGRPREAVERLRQLVAHDPLNTRTALLLMEALAAAGDPANAIEHAGEHVALLRSELDMEPPPAVERLVERLKRAPERGSLQEATASRSAPFGSPATRPSAEPGARFPPFVARDAELARLHRHLDLALAGQGQVMFISGESGTGKTALAREFCRQAMDRHPGLAFSVGKGNAQTGLGDAYLLFRDVLALLTGDVEAGGTSGSLSRTGATRMLDVLSDTGRILARYGPDLVGTFLRREALLVRARQRAFGEPWIQALTDRDQDARADSGPVAQQSDLFRQYTRVLHELAREYPLLIVLDDLQWADDGSVELFFHLARELPPSRILILGLYRGSEVALGRNGGRHPLKSVINELVRRFGDVEVPLLQTGDPRFVEALLDMEPNKLDADFRAALYEQTRGHALFTVELLRDMREKGLLVCDEEAMWVAAPSLSWEKLPARVGAVVAERIDRLPEPLRRALLCASVQGEEFIAEATAELCDMDVGELVRALSGDLEKRHHLVLARGVRRVEGRRLSNYRFRHVLFQKYLYGQLDAVERPSIHEKLGRALEALYGTRADDEAVTLARHFRIAGLSDRAAHYLYAAGEQAMRVAANEAATDHLATAVEELRTLPPSAERDHRELEVQVKLGYASFNAGLPGGAEAFQRGVELAGRAGNQRQLFWALAGLFMVRGHMGGDNRAGRHLAERCLTIARGLGDTGLLVYALEFAGRNAMNRGEFPAVVDHYTELASLYDPNVHHSEVLYWGLDMGAMAKSMTAEATWQLGYPDRAVRLSAEALGLARRREVPQSLPALLYADVIIHMNRRDAAAARSRCEELRRAAVELEQLYWEPYIPITQGWCDVQEGSIDKGIERIREGWDTLVELGWKVWFAYFTSLLAQALGKGGRAEEGLALLDDAHAGAQELEELVGDAEIRRIRGELLLALPNPDLAGAESAFREAIEVARQQEARSYRLRATTSLAKLLASQGRVEEARPMLAEIYGWFTEGFDTADLVEAREVLAELG